MVEKTQVTQDILFEFLTGHSINMSRLSELMGVSNGIVMGCFHHDLNRLGKPLSFSVANVERLNAALPVLAEQIRGCMVQFGSEQMYTTRLGRTYDPGTLPAIKSLSKYFSFNSFAQRVLGWKKGKREAVLCKPSSAGYGRVGTDDVKRINAELLLVSSTLAGMEVEMPDSSCSSSSFSI